MSLVFYKLIGFNLSTSISNGIMNIFTLPDLFVNYSQFFISVILGYIALIFSFSYKNDSYNDVSKLKMNQRKHLQRLFYSMIIIIVNKILESIFIIYCPIIINCIIFTDSLLYLWFILISTLYIYREIRNGSL